MVIPSVTIVPCANDTLLYSETGIITIGCNYIRLITIHSCATNYLQRYIVTFKVSLAWYRYRLCFHPFVIFYKSSTPSCLPSSPPHRSTQKTTITLLNTSPQTQAQTDPGKPLGQRNATTKREQCESRFYMEQIDPEVSKPNYTYCGNFIAPNAHLKQ